MAIKGQIVSFPADRLVLWETTIKLKPDILQQLESIAGPTPDDRFVNDLHDIKLIQEVETWAWFLEPNFRQRICIWFKEPSWAVYFKLLWGGSLG